MQLLPTPRARDFKGRDPNPKGVVLCEAVALLPTPLAADAVKGQRSMGSTGGPSLAAATHLLPTPRATDGTNGGPGQRGSKGDLALGSAVQPEVWGKFAEAIALWERLTGMPAPCPTEPAPKGGLRLNPQLSEWMMGYPAGYLTDVMDRNSALRCAGNGVVTAQARAAWDLLGGDDW